MIDQIPNEHLVVARLYAETAIRAEMLACILSRLRDNDTLVSIAERAHMTGDRLALIIAGKEPLTFEVISDIFLAMEAKLEISLSEAA